MITCTTTRSNPATYKTDLLVISVDAKRRLGPAARALDDASGGHLGRLIDRFGELDKAGASALLAEVDGIKAKRVLVMGTGLRGEADEPAWRKLIASALAATVASGSSNALLCLGDSTPPDRDPAWAAQALALAGTEATYTFNQTHSKKDPAPSLKKIIVHAADAHEARQMKTGCKRGLAIGQGMALCKDLGNLPGNVCTPTYLANQAKQLAKQFDNLKAKALGEADMKRLGMGALLSVSRGSREPAKLIVLEYNGGKKNARPVVLVGKGVTFDSGGISIKPGAAMDEMKYDMCGAAGVLGAMRSAADMKLPINVVGIVPATENLPDGDASKPGDVVTSMSGQTIEVLNTDAEGRLILCDALTYAARFKPQVVVDMATLTGACIIALGHHQSAVLGNDQTLIDELRHAGDHSADPVWQLPMGEEYDKALDSPFADMANIGGRPAGTIVAACFLGRFTGDYRWAHLDIAGVAWRSGKDKGATGRPVPLLTRFLMDRAGLD